MKADIKTSTNNLKLIIGKLRKEFKVEESIITNVINLCLEGATTPFIARYRKELTDKMSEELIHRILVHFNDMMKLEEQKKSLIETIKEHNKLTLALLKEIESCTYKYELDDISFSFKPKTTIESTTAKGKGLETLAIQIYLQKSINQKLKDLANKYVNPQKGLDSYEDALVGAKHIITEWIAEDTECRKKVRELLLKNCAVSSRLKYNPEKGSTAYQMYVNFSKSIKVISHKEIHDILRGVREQVLDYSISFDKNLVNNFMFDRFIRTKERDYREFLEKCVKSAFQNFIYPSLDKEVKEELKKSADEKAVESFGKKIRSLLLSKPADKVNVMGIKYSGLKSRCYVVVIDINGCLIEKIEINPHQSQDEEEKPAKTLKELLDKHKIKNILLGNGSGSSKTEKFLKDNGLVEETINLKLVDESLAKIYAESTASTEEFPELEEGFKTALFFSKYFQDPMAEIVKIDPNKIFGIKNTKEIEKTLFDETIDWNIRSCINFVGVDLNTASRYILRYVSGLNEEIAGNITAYRKKLEDGFFVSRKELMKVQGVDAKIYEQCAGFLRIRNGIHPLDATSIHPESYHIVSRIANKFKCRIQDLLENPRVLSKINYSQFTTKNFGFPTIRDIIYELGNPYRDTRRELVSIPIQQNMKSYKDLALDSVIFGKVTKITNSGVFMDIGVDIEGFVHISEISANYVKDPASILSVGETIKVKVISIDTQKQRISLSIKQTSDSSQ